MRSVTIVVAVVVVGCTSGTATTTIESTTPPRPPSTSTPSPSTSTPTSTTLTPGTSIETSPTTPEPDSPPASLPPENLVVDAFPVPSGSRPHDVAPAADGGVWYTAQGSGDLGWLDPDTGETRHVPLGPGSRPHGVIVDDAGVPWITDGGLNAIVSVDPDTDVVTIHPLPPESPDANLNTATFDGDGTLWFTGQNGVYGSLDPSTGGMTVWDAPGGRGPYGIATTPAGSVYFASLAGSFVGAIASDGSTVVHQPPTAEQGARRVWADSDGNVWVSEWNSGNLSRFEPSSGQWTSWPLPGDAPAAYAVYVDASDIVWVSDFGSNSMVRFDPTGESFTSYPLPHDPGDVRQILGRAGEIWGAESAADHLVRIRTHPEG